MKKFLTADGILGQLEEEQVTLQNAVDVVLMPPEDGELTDEDSEDDKELLPKDPNHFGRGILSQQAELVIFKDDDENQGDDQPDPDDQPTGSQVQCYILSNTASCKSHSYFFL